MTNNINTMRFLTFVRNGIFFIVTQSLSKGGALGFIYEGGKLSLGLTGDA